MNTDTVRIPIVRTLPPAAHDRGDRVRLTRRGRAVREALSWAGVVLAAGFFFGFLNVLGALGVFS